MSLPAQEEDLTTQHQHYWEFEFDVWGGEDPSCQVPRWRNGRLLPLLTNLSACSKLNSLQRWSQTPRLTRCVNSATYDKPVNEQPNQLGRTPRHRLPNTSGGETQARIGGERPPKDNGGSPISSLRGLRRRCFPLLKESRTRPLQIPPRQDHWQTAERATSRP